MATPRRRVGPAALANDAESFSSHEADADDPFVQALADAEIDDEPLTDDQRDAIDEAWKDYLSGNAVSLDEVKRRLLASSTSQ